MVRVTLWVWMVKREKNGWEYGQQKKKIVIRPSIKMGKCMENREWEQYLERI